MPTDVYAHYEFNRPDWHTSFARKSGQIGKCLRSQFGVGPQTAATLLSIAGDNSKRLHADKGKHSNNARNLSAACSRYRVCYSFD